MRHLALPYGLTRHAVRTRRATTHWRSRTMAAPWALNLGAALTCHKSAKRGFQTTPLTARTQSEYVL